MGRTTAEIHLSDYIIAAERGQLTVEVAGTPQRPNGSGEEGRRVRHTRGRGRIFYLLEAGLWPRQMHPDPLLGRACGGFSVMFAVEVAPPNLGTSGLSGLGGNDRERKRKGGREGGMGGETTRTEMRLLAGTG